LYIVYRLMDKFVKTPLDVFTRVDCVDELLDESVYSCPFAITLTLKPAYFRHTAELQYSLTAEKICEALRCNGRNKLSMVTELTEKCNVHYHAVILIAKSLLTKTYATKWLYDRCRLEPIGSQICVKQIDDLDGWKDYLIKDFHKGYQFVPSTVRDDFDLRGYRNKKPKDWVYISKKQPSAVTYRVC